METKRSSDRTSRQFILGASRRVLKGTGHIICARYSNWEIERQHCGKSVEEEIEKGRPTPEVRPKCSFGLASGGFLPASRIEV